MNLVDFMTWVKRESRYGGAPIISGAAAAADRATLDILTSINARRKRIWRKSENWDWQYTQLAFAVTPGTVNYAVTPLVAGAGIDRIRNIIPNDSTVVPPISGKALTLRTERQFFEEINNYDPNYSGIPEKYLNMGRDPVTGLWQIRIWPGPVSAFTMGGSAKGVLNTFIIGDVTGVAPFSAGNIAGVINPPLDYFPDGIIEDVLFEGVMSDVDYIQGDKEGARNKDQSFEAKIKLLAAEQASAAKDNTPITRPLPLLVRRRMASRRR